MNNNSSDTEHHDTPGERIAKIAIFVVVFVAVFAAVYVTRT